MHFNSTSNKNIKLLLFFFLLIVVIIIVIIKRKQNSQKIVPVGRMGEVDWGTRIHAKIQIEQQHCEKGVKEKAICNAPLHASLSLQCDVLLLTPKHVLLSSHY